jgi:hypothetical protein
MLIRARMNRLFSIWILAVMIPTLSTAHEAKCATAVDLELDELRWKNRILLLFSPSESDPTYRSQKQELASRFQEGIERDLLILEILEHGESRAGERVLSEKAVEAIRRRFGVRSGLFHLFLIGKDGTVKLRSDKPVAAQDIFGLIDSLPMRRQEIESKRIPSS